MFFENWLTIADEPCFFFFVFSLLFFSLRFWFAPLGTKVIVVQNCDVHVHH